MVDPVGLCVVGAALAAVAFGFLRRRRARDRSNVTTHLEAPVSAGPTQPAPYEAIGQVRGCPVCLSEFPGPNRFCIKDGAELTETSSSQRFAQGAICPTCRRIHPADAEYCPLDGDSLVPYGLYSAAKAVAVPEWPSTSKICPECGDRCSTSRQQFCGRDGTPLVALN
jgi:RNA polymerase subunit RPABC4/transcription elongation factor Spt4